MAEALLQLPWPIDLGLTVASHGWVHLEPWRWDPKTGTLSRAERIAGRVGTIAMRQRDPTTLIVTRRTALPAQRGYGNPAPRRALDLGGWSPEAALTALAAGFAEEAALIARGGGRLLRCSTFYEDFIKTILTINTTWSSTERMSAALVAEPGGGAFPSPQMLIDYGEERLRQIAKLGFRAPVVMSATQRMLDEGTIDAAGHGAEDRLDHHYLVSLKGIGPYAAAHCRMLLHDFSRIPVDSVVVAHLRERHDTTPEAFIAARAECGIYLGLGYRLMRLKEKFQVAQVDVSNATPPSNY